MLNSCIFMGRLVRDPELKRTQNGTAVVPFTIAVERDFTGADGKRETDFLDCVAWKGKAEFISKYFAKGSMVCVDGQMQSRKWTDKDGNKRVSWELQVSNIHFCGEKRDTSNTYDEADATPPPELETVEDDGDLPF